jgi:hypothetical protein
MVSVRPGFPVGGCQPGVGTPRDLRGASRPPRIPRAPGAAPLCLATCTGWAGHHSPHSRSPVARKRTRLVGRSRYFYAAMSLRSRPGPRPDGFIEPCLPSARSLPPPGGNWLHDQARRLPDAGAPRRGGDPAFHPQRLRLDGSLPAHQGRNGRAQGALLLALLNLALGSVDSHRSTQCDGYDCDSLAAQVLADVRLPHGHARPRQLNGDDRGQR